jgi:hypothetical protein
VRKIVVINSIRLIVRKGRHDESNCENLIALTSSMLRNSMPFGFSDTNSQMLSNRSIRISWLASSFLSSSAFLFFRWLIISVRVFYDAGKASVFLRRISLKTILFFIYFSVLLTISSISSNHLIRIRRISGLLHLKSNLLNYSSVNGGVLSLNFLPIRYLSLPSWLLSPLVNILDISL